MLEAGNRIGFKKQRSFSTRSACFALIYKPYEFSMLEADNRIDLKNQRSFNTRSACYNRSRSSWRCEEPPEYASRYWSLVSHPWIVSLWLSDLDCTVTSLMIEGGLECWRRKELHSPQWRYRTRCPSMNSWLSDLLNCNVFSLMNQGDSSTGDGTANVTHNGIPALSPIND